MVRLEFNMDDTVDHTGLDNCNSTGLSSTQRNILLYVFGGVGVFARYTDLCYSIIHHLLLSFRLYKRFAHRLVIYQLLSAIIFSLVCSAELSFLNYDYDDEGTMWCSGVSSKCNCWNKIPYHLLVDILPLHVCRILKRFASS